MGALFNHVPLKEFDYRIEEVVIPLVKGVHDEFCKTVGVNDNPPCLGTVYDFLRKEGNGTVDIRAAFQNIFFFDFCECCVQQRCYIFDDCKLFHIVSAPYLGDSIVCGEGKYNFFICYVLYFC